MFHLACICRRFRITSHATGFFFPSRGISKRSRGIEGLGSASVDDFVRRAEIKRRPARSTATTRRDRRDAKGERERAAKKRGRGTATSKSATAARCGLSRGTENTRNPETSVRYHSSRHRCVRVKSGEPLAQRTTTRSPSRTRRISASSRKLPFFFLSSTKKHSRERF